MKNPTFRYTSKAARALKGSRKINCYVSDTDNGTGHIYVTNGAFLWRMTAAEYAAVVQPVVYCEPGDWTIENGDKRPGGLNLEKFFNGLVESAPDADTQPMARAPLTIQTDRKTTVACYYSADDDFAALYDVNLISALTYPELRSSGPTAAAVASFGGDPYAVVMPIRPGKQATAAVRAWFAAEE